MWSSKDDSVPPTAIEVKVTSIKDPYLIRIHKVQDYTAKAEEITKKIQALIRKQQLRVSSATNFKPGDVVVIHNGICTSTELPAWSCRGLLGELKDPEQKIYSVFLMDYGIALDVSASEFIKISKNSIPDEHLTFTIGLCDVIPIVAKVEKLCLVKEKERFCAMVVKNWSSESINYAKNWISKAKKICFDPLARTQGNIKLGELYLFIEDTIFPLREILVLNYHAIHVTDRMQNVLKYGENGKWENQNLTFPYSLTINEQEKNGDVPDDYPKIKKIGFSALFTKSPNRTKRDEGQSVLVQSDFHIQKVDVLSAVAFHTKIHKVLTDKNIVNLTNIQKYMWPGIIQGLNIVVVGSSGKGKTLGHAAAVSSLVTSAKLPKAANEPVALILCSSTKEVFEMHRLYGDMIKSFNCIKIVSAFNGKSEKLLASHIFNGCQIFITTPPYLVRLLTGGFKNANVLDLTQTQFVVFDKADVIFDKYYESVMVLIKRFKIIREAQHSLDDTPFQILAVAQKWSNPLKQFVYLHVKNPSVLVDSCMEAAIYSGVKSRALIVKSNEKTQKLLEILQNNDDMKKTIVICAKTEEVIEVENYLKKNGKNTISAHGKMVSTEIDDVEDYWCKSVSGLFPIFVCSDEVLHEMTISDVDHMINYSLPPVSKREFHFRFTTLMNNLIERTKQSQITMMLDETNDLQLKSLIDPLTRLNIKIPEAWIASAASFIMKEDRRKTNAPICDKFKSLGFCPNQDFCSERHCVFKDVDKPSTNLQRDDEVSLMVTFIHDASHLSARVVEYKRMNENGKKVKHAFEVDFMTLTTQMQAYYAQPKNRSKPKTIEVGKIYTWEQTFDKFLRVKILKIMSFNKFGFPYIVKIRNIDNGTVLEVDVVNILHISEELANKPSHIIEVFMLGIAPYDDEFDWNECTNKEVQNWFRTHNKKTTTNVIGKVVLHVGETIWVDTLEVKSEVSGYSDLVLSSLKPYLIKENHAVANDKHLPNLLKVCRKAGFD